MMKKTYSELCKLDTYEERLKYLRIPGQIGEDTFGWARHINQKFYNSKIWKDKRREIILRDRGCDLGVPGHEIPGYITIHHLNPITEEDLLNFSPKALDSENLICVSRDTHEMIHWSEREITDPYKITERRPGDTNLWTTQS